MAVGKVVNTSHRESGRLSPFNISTTASVGKQRDLLCALDLFLVSTVASSETLVLDLVSTRPRESAAEAERIMCLVVNKGKVIRSFTCSLRWVLMTLFSGAGASLVKIGGCGWRFYQLNDS